MDLPDLRRFTDEERHTIATCDSPEKVQSFIDAVSYSYEADGVARLRSFRRVVRDRLAHCFEGAIAAATILAHHGHPPRILCMEARDIDHMMFLYREGRRLGSVAQSRDANLKGRPPVYATVRDLVMSYYPHYWNAITGDHSDLTLRGYSIIDLRNLEGDWMTAEDDLWPAEDLTYQAKYRALFPENGAEEFISNRDGSITWM
ncbi:MAG: hypothetical protein PHS73_00890 [Candidatus Peribacteraceae bacterium]|nr:hypothetical protein [Candidatus Peribacteraceae bacterium]